MSEYDVIPKKLLVSEWLWRIWTKPFFFVWWMAEPSGIVEQPTYQNDREWINQQAQRLLDSYGNSLLRFAYSYVHNLSDAEEMVQDTLMQYFKTVPSIKSKQHEKAWLMHVCANLSKNRLDYNARRQADELTEMLAADQQEDLSFVWQAVKALPPKEREIIHLFYYEGYSSVEIAKLLGKKDATVRSLLKRGRTKLKTVLKEAYDFEEI